MYSKQFLPPANDVEGGNIFCRVCYSVCPTRWSHGTPNEPLLTYSLGNPPHLPPAVTLPTHMGTCLNLFTPPPPYTGHVQNWSFGMRAEGLRLKGLLICLNFNITWNVRRLSRSHIMYERKTESDPSALNTEQYELRRVRTSADTARSASSAEWCKSTIVRNPS